mgnify:CR=1 FL=1
MGRSPTAVRSLLTCARIRGAVTIKWNKKKFPGVEVLLEEPTLVFKAALCSLTGVEPEHQKIVVKGGMVKASGRPVSGPGRAGRTRAA